PHGWAPALFAGPSSGGARGTTASTMPSTYTGPGAFGRMFPELAPFRPSDASLIELGAAMEDVDFGDNPDDLRGDNPGVPAGYTYFGQFVDHDITFDKTIGFPPPLLDPTLIEQARTPTLDLDSLYGMGPALQPELYEPGDPPDRARFRIGRTSAVASIA